jgi:hypothetical protein
MRKLLDSAQPALDTVRIKQDAFGKAFTWVQHPLDDAGRNHDTAVFNSSVPLIQDMVKALNDYLKAVKDAGELLSGSSTQ